MSWICEQRGPCAFILENGIGIAFVQDGERGPLIAAAPDLLEACMQALAFIEGDECLHGRKFFEGSLLRSAIAKAEGKP